MLKVCLEYLRARRRHVASQAACSTPTTRAARAAAVAVMFDSRTQLLATVSPPQRDAQAKSLVKRRFPSSSSDAVYTAMIDTHTLAASCVCKGWIYKRRNAPRSCKHIKALIAEFKPGARASGPRREYSESAPRPDHSEMLAVLVGAVTLLEENADPIGRAYRENIISRINTILARERGGEEAAGWEHEHAMDAHR